MFLFPFVNRLSGFSTYGGFKKRQRGVDEFLHRAAGCCGVTQSQRLDKIAGTVQRHIPGCRVVQGCPAHQNDLVIDPGQHLANPAIGDPVHPQISKGNIGAGCRLDTFGRLQRLQPLPKGGNIGV